MFSETENPYINDIGDLPLEGDFHSCIWGDIQPSCDDFGGGYPYMVCEICGAINSIGELD